MGEGRLADGMDLQSLLKILSRLYTAMETRYTVEKLSNMEKNGKILQLVLEQLADQKRYRTPQTKKGKRGEDMEGLSGVKIEHAMATGE